MGVWTGTTAPGFGGFKRTPDHPRYDGNFGAAADPVGAKLTLNHASTRARALPQPATPNPQPEPPPNWSPHLETHGEALRSCAPERGALRPPIHNVSLRRIGDVTHSYQSRGRVLWDRLRMEW